MIREFLRHCLLELAKETLSSHSVRSVQWEVSNGFGVWGYLVGEKMAASLITFRVFSCLGSLSTLRVGPKVVVLQSNRCPKSITVVFQKHVEIVENPQDDFC